jgi:hypothetical protein
MASDPAPAPKPLVAPAPLSPAAPELESRLVVFRQLAERPISLPQFVMPTAPATREAGTCWACGEASSEPRCRRCAEASMRVVVELQHARAVAAYEKAKAAEAAKAAAAGAKAAEAAAKAAGQGS